jgi:hypothetical protein
MIVHRWESEGRYYIALLYQDLFCMWLLRTVWGGRFSKLGNEKCKPVNDMASGLAALARIDAVRRRRGYYRVKVPDAIFDQN